MGQSQDGELGRSRVFRYIVSPRAQALLSNIDVGVSTVSLFVHFLVAWAMHIACRSRVWLIRDESALSTDVKEGVFREVGCSTLVIIVVDQVGLKIQVSLNLL